MLRLSRLTPAQRVILVIGLGAALLVIGRFVTSSGTGPASGWVGYRPGFYLMGVMDAWAQLVTWLVLVALWVAASLVILRPPAEPSPQPSAGDSSPAA